MDLLNNIPRFAADGRNRERLELIMTAYDDAKPDCTLREYAQRAVKYGLPPHRFALDDDPPIRRCLSIEGESQTTGALSGAPVEGTWHPIGPNKWLVSLGYFRGLSVEFDLLGGDGRYYSSGATAPTLAQWVEHLYNG
jgi:hypothetical protein